MPQLAPDLHTTAVTLFGCAGGVVEIVTIFFYRSAGPCADVCHRTFTPELQSLGLRVTHPTLALIATLHAVPNHLVRPLTIPSRW